MKMLTRPILAALMLAAPLFTVLSLRAQAKFPFYIAPSARAQARFPFQDASLPVAQRVDDLVARLTLDEKVSQMMTDAPAIPRLGIPAYYWWSECLHGDAVSPATVFPQAIGLAATWDIPLHSRVASAISDEDRANYNENGGAGKPRPFHGLTYFAPNINIFRDPRWGRGQETYGEDPYLTSQFGVAYVKGLQGNDPKYFKVIATPKHFAVHSGPEPLRHRFDAVVSDYDLFDTYLVAFHATVTQGHAQSVMGAYSSLDGIPDCANPRLLGDILRKQWGFDGYVVSDCGAIGDISGGHHYAPNNVAGSALAVKAGCDLSCGGEYHALVDSVKQGLISEADIDRSVKRLFRARMKLGMFDPPSQVPYARIPPSVIDSPAHRLLARQAALESIVLLKNESHLLPFGKAVKSLAVIGPNADAAAVQRGNYNGISSREVSILAGIRRRAAAAHVDVEYVQGCGLTDLSDVRRVPGAFLRSGGKPGLRGEYFNNQDLQGTPVAVRRDPQVAFNFTGRGPVPGLTADNYSVRWTGEIVAPQDGDYTLGVRGDDGFRLFVNGRKLLDDWGVHPAETRTATLPLKAGQAVPIRLEYFQATEEAEVTLLWRRPGQAQFADALAAARRADAVVFVGGISAQLEGEEGTNGNGDRTSLDLPGVQENLLQALAATGKPMVLVLMSGSALSVNWAQAHVPAIVQAWYPGEEGGAAVAQVLFGDYNPAGRLPVTYYRSISQLPAFTDYAMKDRTYRYFTGRPLYPFGYGLSYTRFQYRSLRLPRRVARGHGATVTAEVTNIGSRTGDEVAELYLRPAPGMTEARRVIMPGQPMPRLRLAGFARIRLAPRQSKTVAFTLSPDQLLLVNARGRLALQPGTWQVFVGGHQPPVNRRDPQVLTGTLQAE